MMTCREASRLLSRRMDEPLTLPQRAGLTLHLAICTACKRVGHQFALMRRALTVDMDPDRAPGQNGRSDNQGRRD